MNVIPPIIKPVTRQAWATASLLFLSLLPVLPLFAPWTFAPIASFHKEWLAVAAGLLAAVALLPSLWRMDRLQIPKSILIPFGLIVYLALQSKLLPHVIVQHAQMAMVYLMWMSVLIILVSALRETLPIERMSCWLAGGLAAAATLASTMELFNRLQGKEGWWGGVAQANNYADLLMLGGVSLLFLQNRVTSPYKSWLSLIGLLIAMGLSLTSSRSVWLYFATLMVLSWCFQKNWLRGLLLGFVGYLSFQTVWTLDLLPQQQSAIQRLVQEVQGAPVRWHIWRVAWDLFLQKPLLGHGFGQFDWAYFQAGNHIPDLATRMEHAHNLIMHLLVELGVLPVLLLVIALIAWFKPLLSTKTNTPADLRAWLLMLTAVLGIHSMLEYPLWYTEFLGVAALILALADNRRWQIRLSKITTAVFGGVIAFGIGMAGVYEWQYTRMELALLATMANPTHQRFEHLVNVCKDIPDKAHLLFPYVPVIFSITSEVTDGQMRRELTALTDAGYRFWPTDKLAYRQALMQALGGNDVESRKTFKLALQAYPNGLDPFFGELMHLNLDDLKKFEPLMSTVATAAIKRAVAQH